VAARDTSEAIWLWSVTTPQSPKSARVRTGPY
jgi:hypothetical protein